MTIAAAQAQVQRARQWLATLRYRQSIGIVDVAEVEGRLLAELAAADDALLAAEMREMVVAPPRPAVVKTAPRPAPVPVVTSPPPWPPPSPRVPVTVRRRAPPPVECRCQWGYGGEQCRGYRGRHPQFCWAHRSAADGGPCLRPPPPPPAPDVAAAPSPADRLVRAKPCALTDEACWEQAPGSAWQRGQRIGWHREVVLRPEQPPVRCACGSVDLTYTGRAWWCNACDTQVDPPDPGADEVIVYDVTVPGASFGVAASQDDADYREATRLFRAGAVTHRPFGWVSPRWDRWKEGQPPRRR